MLKIAIINGPNLNLLGKRQPEIYGTDTFETTLARLREDLPDCEFECHQSNSEGEIIDLLQRIGYSDGIHGIILNPGGYAHYSVAIADAIASIPVPVIEVHISNTHSRETFRQQMVTARSAKAVIAGCGRDGYRLAALHLLRLSE